MKWRYIVWILPALLIGVLLIWGCSDSREDDVFAQPLTLATPASSPAGEVGGMALPQQIVGVTSTPTPAQDATGQQDQGQQNQGNQSGEGDQELIDMGEQIYTSNCASCHQPNGEGTSAYPALSGSPSLTGEDPASAIDVVVNGRGLMPAFGNSLSTEEIAAVISYERNAWRNSAGVVTADQVRQFQEGDGTQASGDAAQGEGTQEQGTPPPEAPAGQNGGTGEVQATPAPEAGGMEQTGDAAAGQETPAGAVSQVSVSQEQGTTVIKIRIEIVIVTAEAAPEEPEASPTPPEPGAEAQTTPAPAAEDDGEAAASDAQATPAPEAAQPQETPTPEDEGAGVGETGEEVAAAPADDRELLHTGESLYGTTCANCHQLSGEGNTAYPSLVNNEVVIAEDPSAALLTILNGRGHMPAFVEMLSDQEIAAVLSHERTAWDNSASVVTAEQVAQVREGGE